MIRKSCFALITVLLLSILISVAYSDEVETFNVNPGTEKIFTLNLSQGLDISCSISISGGSGDDVDFWITNPSGIKILDLGRVSQGTQFDFIADQDGAYSLHFDNSFSLFSTKNVVITYEVTRAGMNQTQLLLLAFIVIVIIIVGIIIILKKGKNSK